VLWFTDPTWRVDVRSTFINRNHFATWAGLTLLCVMALFYQRYGLSRNPAYTVPLPREDRVERFVLDVWKPLAVILLVSTALILSHSRAGFFSTLAGSVVLLWALHSRQRLTRGQSLAVLGGMAVAAILAFALTSEVLLKRLDQLSVGTEERWAAYTLAADGIEDNPLLGFGYGTFSDSFRLYRNESLSAHFDRAHNTYLENLFELGWPAALALFASVFQLILICVQGVRKRRRDWVYPATALAAAVLVALHSLFDFSLQLPAVAMTFACILGVGCAQSRNPVRSHSA